MKFQLKCALAAIGLLLLGCGGGPQVQQAQAVGERPQPTIDPARFLGDRTSDWGGTIPSELIITKVTPDGYVYGMYIWGQASFTKGGSFEFRAPVHGRTIAFGDANNGRFPFYSFTLNDDGTVSATRRTLYIYSSGKFSAPKPIAQTSEGGVNLGRFAGNWSCSWKPYDYILRSATHTSLVIKTVNAAAKTASGTNQGNELPGSWGYSSPQGAFTGQIVGNTIRIGDSLEFTLNSSGDSLRGVHYIEGGYEAWVIGSCTKGS